MSASNTTPSATENTSARDISRDGAKIVDMQYYDLLGVRGDAADIDLKKAYRKAAIKNHPDKGGDEEVFKMIGEAYRVLSDNHLRADYDKYGKKKPQEEVGIKEATDMFGTMFGGERFVDLIGEVSMLKNMAKASEIMMTEEEREEMEKQMRAEVAKNPENGSDGAATPSVAGVGDAKATTAAAAAATATTTERGTSASTTTDPSSPSTSAEVSTETNHRKMNELAKGKHKLTEDQKQKLEDLEKEKDESEKKRIEELTQKLKDRIRPFVEARNPGDKDDSETQLFARKMREEAEDLKLESFGVELLHTIGNMYTTKATASIKSKKHNFLGFGGFMNRMKEKGSVIKDTWGMLGSAINVKTAMDEMVKRQEKGELTPEELQALEKDLTGKMLLVTWRGTRFEVNNVLRQVCDNVLNEKGVNDKTLFKRAQALLFLGTIYKQVEPDESDDERRELERLVADAAGKKKKKDVKKEKKA